MATVFLIAYFFIILPGSAAFIFDDVKEGEKQLARYTARAEKLKCQIDAGTATFFTRFLYLLYVIFVLKGVYALWLFALDFILFIVAIIVCTLYM